MPAFVNSRLGAVGMRDDDGTIACCFDAKKSRNDWRIWAEVIAENGEQKTKDSGLGGESKVSGRSTAAGLGWPAKVFAKSGLRASITGELRLLFIGLSNR